MLSIAVTIVIYSSLFFGRPIAENLQENQLVTAFFVAGFVLVIATIMIAGLGRNPGKRQIVIAIGIVAIYFLTAVRIKSTIERSHLLEFSILAVFIYQAFHEGIAQGRQINRAALLAILIASLIGIIDECLQIFIPSRVFDLQDIAFNVLASIMGVGSVKILRWIRGKFT